MRRKSRFMENPSAVERILRSAEVGCLGILTTDGKPRAIPVNFAAEGTTIFIHGAVKGEKIEALRANPEVSFSVYIPHSVIPSYWLSDDPAHGASHYYESVQVDGRCTIVEGLEEKARALQDLMVKYQPEGKFLEVCADEPAYEKALRITAIFRIDPERVTYKASLGQDRSVEFRRRIIGLLQKRDRGADAATAEAVARTISDGD